MINGVYNDGKRNYYACQYDGSYSSIAPLYQQLLQDSDWHVAVLADDVAIIKQGDTAIASGTIILCNKANNALSTVSSLDGYNKGFLQPAGGGGEVSWNDITDKPAFGTLATKNSVNLASGDVTGNLANTRVDGLGSLATKSSIASTDITGQLTTAQISGLGSLATKNSVDLTSGEVIGVLAVAKGGTGGTTAAAGRTGLELGTMATRSNVSSLDIVDGSVITSKLGAFAVTKDKIATGAITSTQIANSAVSADKIASGAVTTDKLANLAVTEAKIANGAINLNPTSNAKIANRLSANYGGFDSSKVQ